MVSGGAVRKSKERAKKYILPIIKLISKTGLSPNFFTFISFICGLFSVYFLFEDILLFAIFSILAIIFDIIDGNLARYLKTESKIGFYLDQGNDRIINFLLLLKYIFVFGQYLFILPMYILHYSLFLIFKTKKVIYVRTFIVISFIIGGFFNKAYGWGVICSVVLLSIGLILQIAELSKRYCNRERKK